MSDNLTQKQTPSSLRKVLAPKLDGAVNAVGALATARPARGVAYFSSIAALLGNAGQANYSAANAALDALATSQQSLVRMHGLVQNLLKCFDTVLALALGIAQTFFGA